jgi:hypothetical protein
MGNTLCKISAGIFGKNRRVKEGRKENKKLNRKLLY